MQGGLTPKALICIWKELIGVSLLHPFFPPRGKRGWCCGLQPQIYGSASCPLPTLSPLSPLCHWCLLLKAFWSQKDSPHPLWLNSEPLGAWQSYGSLLPPPESRLAFPGSWELAGLSVGTRLPYGWCSGRNGTSWAGVAVCIPWHDGLDLHSCST